jgi:ferrochelatase
VKKTGVLLMNIGTPASYEVADVKKYLTEFLMDKDVISLPYPLRWALVNLLIVPKRGPYSAANYKKVWMEEGSPLLVYSKRMCEKFQRALGEQYSVKLGLRYSEPSPNRALQEFHDEGCEKIVVFPLFPQYAEATSGSSIKEFKNILKKMKSTLPIEIVPPFYDKKFFINTSALIAKRALQGKNPDHFLFSFHGLPESQVREVQGCLVSDNCCQQKMACNKNCYRAQCLASAKSIAQAMGLNANQWSVGFQSRLGRAKWIGPSTDEMIADLRTKNISSLAVLCPSFVADCIETLEEIGIGAREDFIKQGGKEFHLVPCMNDEGWEQAALELFPGS